MEIPVDALAVVLAPPSDAPRRRRAHRTADPGSRGRSGERLRAITLLSTLALAAAFAGAGAATTPGSSDARGDAPALALDRNAALRASAGAIGRTPADYVLTTSAGQRLRLAELRGKPLVVHFVYTGCTQVCPPATAFLAGAVGEARRAVGRDAFNVLTIGFNLPFDNPPAMRAFAREHGIDEPGWIAASPERDDVAALARDFGFSYVATPAGFDHIAQVTIVDASGRIVDQVYGDSFALPMLIGPLKALASGAPLPPAGGIKAVVERVRLWCTVYDPATGRYRLDYSLVIELVAGATILGGTLLYLASGYRRRRD
ncbi:MAG TPA: SCO family protein [Casimicrobiaceae bacterium]